MPSIVSESFVLRGSIEKTHNIRIDGTIVGDIKDANVVVIGTNGVVQGNVKAIDLVVFGYIEGNISAVNSISIKNTGKIKGELDAKILTLEHGATYEGIISMEPSTS
ncbi:polymer-forming cytoskeletal protein [Dysgonomonas sp. Marseille-P4677]|uniref:bactofilin family protein n=1 Tax=Dysgonomonas sp. Marseille-P4677 TaxID=2364790 RepID=UPI0019137C1D|nr:polymer-forming cytoskeletal protein [Dysgonomonas sp. Marseille-P4677]MBK5720909.1 polymer-forming cytoskeletal protein [Dysgonomonas sp. Marseille-P4677]